MNIQSFFHAAHSQLRSEASPRLGRSHLYELVAAAFGYGSYAALRCDAVPYPGGSPLPVRASGHIHARAHGLDYTHTEAAAMASSLTRLLGNAGLGVVRYSTLISHLRAQPENWLVDADDNANGEATPKDLEDVQAYRRAIEDGYDWDDLGERLALLASEGVASAHYVLALMLAPSDDDELPILGHDYWFGRAAAGESLSPNQQQFADEYAASLKTHKRCVFHFREAARLGSADARFELAARCDDPTFFESPPQESSATPQRVAEVAMRLGRRTDARTWLTQAALRGDVESMATLITEFDAADPVTQWKWMYVSQGLGYDLSLSRHVAINEDGSEWDEDIGGPAYVGGDEGIHLDPLDEVADEEARRLAGSVLDEIRGSHAGSR